MTEFPNHESDKYWRIDKIMTPTFLSGYYEKDVKDWFHQCIASRPAITPSYRSKFSQMSPGTGDDTMNRYPIHPTHKDWLRWFEKWFLQFKEME